MLPGTVASPSQQLRASTNQGVKIAIRESLWLRDAACLICTQSFASGILLGGSACSEPS